MIDAFAPCVLCPRRCGVNRRAGETGFCGEGDLPVVVRAALHFWEEPCISGGGGSGAVFFSGCSLRCIFCQNAAISSERAGVPVTVDRLAQIFLSLQKQGAVNLNLVTASHFAPAVKEALRLSKAQGLILPVVYNCGGYESMESLRLLKGLVDIYLPDFKYMTPALAERYSSAPDYPEVCKQALSEMFSQVGPAQFSEDGLMKKGLLVRHLVLPGKGGEARRVIRYLYETYGSDIFVSIMNQYTPMPKAARTDELGRRLSAGEYARVVDYAVTLGLQNGFIQEGKTGADSFIPPFDLTGVL